MTRALKEWARGHRDRLVLRLTVGLLRLYFVGRRVHFHRRRGVSAVDVVDGVEVRDGSFFLHFESSIAGAVVVDIRRGYQDPRTKRWHFHEE